MQPAVPREPAQLEVIVKDHIACNKRQVNPSSCGLHHISLSLRLMSCWCCSESFERGPSWRQRPVVSICIEWLSCGVRQSPSILAGTTAHCFPQYLQAPPPTAPNATLLFKVCRSTFCAVVRATANAARRKRSARRRRQRKRQSGVYFGSLSINYKSVIGQFSVSVHLGRCLLDAGGQHVRGLHTVVAPLPSLK